MERKQTMKSRLAALGVLAAVAAGTGYAAPALGAEPDDAAVANSLPTGAEVMAKYIDAIGGADAIEAVKGRKSVGTYALPAMGIEASLVLVAAAPDKMRMKVDVPNFGTEESGTNGEVVWALSSTNGPRVLEGAEAEAIAEQADIDGDLKWAERFSSIETTGEEEIDGTPVYVVELVNASTGKNETRCFAKDSGLLIQMRQIQTTQMGDMPSTTTLSDYRDVGGVLFPHKMVINAGQMEQIITMTEVTADPELPEGYFDPPAEVQALIDG